MTASQATFRNVFTVSEVSIKPGEVKTVELLVKVPGTFKQRMVNHPVAIRMASDRDCFTPFSFGELALLTRFGTIGPTNCIKVDVKNCAAKYGHIDKDTKFGSVVSLVDDAYSRPLLPKCHVNEALPPRDYVLVAVDAQWVEWTTPTPGSSAATSSSRRQQEIVSVAATDFGSCHGPGGHLEDCFFQASLPSTVRHMIEGGNVEAKKGNMLKKLCIKPTKRKGHLQEELVHSEPNGYTCPLKTEAEVLQNLLAWMQQEFHGHKVILVTYDWTKAFENLFRERLSKHNLLGQFKKLVKGRVTFTTGLTKAPPNLNDLAVLSASRAGAKRKWEAVLPAGLEACRSLATCVVKSLGTKPNYVNFVSVYALHEVFIFNKRKAEVASASSPDAQGSFFNEVDMTIRCNSKPRDSDRVELKRIR